MNAITKLAFHPLSVAGVTIVVGLAVYSLHQTIQEIERSADTLQAIDAEIKQAEAEVATLQQQLSAAESDFAKEKILRDELLLQRPGEYVVQLPPLPSPSPQPQVETKSTPFEEWQTMFFQKK